MKILNPLRRQLTAFSLIAIACTAMTLDSAITMKITVENEVKQTSELQDNQIALSDAPQEASLFQPQGLLIETVAGQILQSQNEDLAYNPASGVKILTALAVLHQLGPQFRFKTKIKYQGAIRNQVLNGTISFDGCDPFFNQEQLVQLATEFTNRGIKSAAASLAASSDFVFQTQSGNRAIGALYRALRKTKLNLHLPQKAALPLNNSTFGEITIESKSLLDIVKDCLSRSDNVIAEKLGQLVGGPTMVSQIAMEQAGLPTNSISLETSSGLGINRVTPKAMITILSQFKVFLKSQNLDLSDALPVAGIDHGTIFKRFAKSKIKGAMTAKTGTLKETDHGASVLVGELSTQNQGKILFVVFQKGRNTAQLRQQQNQLVEQLLVSSGGPGGKYK
ncbi:MAG: D-alanyl-D-alanine carboxypeptidase [Candidatus Obscuribacterales bacterium]|nr:D-alanyl-D-alanine carboxypeptidase [Candidatus Obscuribacterales bacterium]